MQARDPKGNLAVFRYDEGTWQRQSSVIAVSDSDDDGQVATSRLLDEYGNRTQSDFPNSTSDNLLSNGSFEEPLSTGWTGGSQQPSEIGTIPAQGPYVGDSTLSFGVTGPGGPVWLASEQFSVVPGETYQLSGSLAGEAALMLQRYNGSGGLLPTVTVVQSSGVNDCDLHRIAGTFVIPPSTGKVRVVCYGDTFNGALFDNIRFEKANAVGTVSFTDNESFERTSSGLPLRWAKCSTGTASHSATSGVQVAAGRTAAAIVSSDGGAGDGFFVSPMVGVSTGERYTISGWIKTVGVKTSHPATGGSEFSATLFSSSGSLVSRVRATSCLVTGTTEWTRYVRTFEVPAGAVHMRADAHVWSADGTSYFDAITIEPANGTETYVYDPATHSFRIQTTTRAGHVLSGEADDYGRPVVSRAASAAGDVPDTLSESVYDDLGRLTAVRTAPEGALGIEAHYAYTPTGQLRTVTGPRGAVTTLSYDPAGRLAAVEDPTGRITEAVYDSLGRSVGLIAPHASGEATSLLASVSFDAYARVSTTTAYALGSTATAVTGMRYDIGSRVTSIVCSGDTSGWVGFSYDDLGRATASVAQGPAGALTVSTSYDRASLPTRTSWTAVSATGSVNNTYAKTNQWLSTSGLGYTWSLAGGVDGRLMSVQSTFSSRLLSYDDAGRLETVRIGLPYGYTPDLLHQYADITLGYDGRDRVASSEVVRDPYYPDKYTDRYSYDAAGRLAGWQRDASAYAAEPGAAATYSYDAAGNLTERSGDVPATLAYDLADRIESMTSGSLTTTFTHDALGRMTARTRSAVTTSYGWDASGHLTTVADGETTCTYSYGVSGMRERSTISGSGATRTVDDVWLSGKLIARRVTEGTSTALLRFLYGPGGIPLQLQVARSGEATVDYAYQLDAAGSVIGLTGVDGAEVARYAYDPWGAPAYIGGSDAWLRDANPLRYRGYCWDADTALYYLPARYYDPALARFLSPDPAAPSADNPASLNRYTYCLDDPVNHYDPTGAYVPCECDQCIAEGRVSRHIGHAQPTQSGGATPGGTDAGRVGAALPAAPPRGVAAATTGGWLLSTTEPDAVDWALAGSGAICDQIWAAGETELALGTVTTGVGGVPGGMVAGVAQLVGWGIDTVSVIRTGYGIYAGTKKWGDLVVALAGFLPMGSTATCAYYAYGAFEKRLGQ